MQVHQYVSNGFHMILDVPSGSVHVGDELFYEAVEAYTEALANAVVPAAEANAPAAAASTPPVAAFVIPDARALEIPADTVLVAAETALRERKHLPKGEAPDEVDEVFAEIAQLRREGGLFSPEPYRPSVEKFVERPTVVKALCLHIAHDCNLACRYCFAEEGEYHGRRALMSLEVGKKAVVKE